MNEGKYTVIPQSDINESNARVAAELRKPKLRDCDIELTLKNVDAILRVRSMASKENNELGRAQVEYCNSKIKELLGV